MAMALLSHLWLMVTNTGIDDIPILIWIIRLLPVPFAVYLGKLWKDRGFQILFFYFLLFFFRCYISNQESIFRLELSESVFSALWLFSACYGLGFVLKDKQLNRFICLLAIIWIVWITVFSCIGIYALWTDQSIRFANDARVGFGAEHSHRLNLIYLPTVTGALLSISSLMTTIMAIANRKKAIRMICIILTLILLFALALTSTRTAYISFSAGLCIIVFLVFVINHLRKIGNKGNKKQIAVLLTIGLVIMVMVFVISVICLMRIIPIFNQIKTQGIITRAYATEKGTAGIWERGFDGDRVLSGRTELYQEILNFIKAKKSILLTGESKDNPLSAINPAYSHCHSIYLQILLESGIPGCLLLFIFIIQSCRCSTRVFLSYKSPIWIKMLLGLLVSMLVADFVECFIWLRSSQCLMTTVFFICTGILCAQSTSPKCK